MPTPLNDPDPMTQVQYILPQSRLTTTGTKADLDAKLDSIIPTLWSIIFAKLDTRLSKGLYL